jgi:hypothetical protein
VKSDGAKPKQAGKDATRTISSEFKPIGLPGEEQYIYVQPHYPDEHDPRNQSQPLGSRGHYKVEFTFCRPGFPPLPEYQISSGDTLVGDSHLAVAKPAFPWPEGAAPSKLDIRMTVENDSFLFVGIPNSKGYLQKIVIESIYGASFVDAQLKAYRYLAPALSNWSVHLDIPLSIYQIDIKEIATGQQMWTWFNSYQGVPFAFVPKVMMRQEFRSYASLYREALNSNTPVYRFLCFFKIIEGIQCRRNRVNAEARKKGEQIKHFDERVPQDPADLVPWLKAICHTLRQWDPMSQDSIFVPEAIGRKFGWIIENQLRPLRTRIAHAITDSGELTVLSDEIVDLQKVNRWLPLAKCMARRMLKNEFPDEFLSYLGEDGKIKVK